MDLYAQKIYTSTGVTKENVFTQGEKVLHIGSGSRVLKGATTVDALALPGVDTVHDLDVFPWPYEDATFDVVYGQNVLEHLTDTVRVMEEIWRILSPKGRVVITVPYFRSVDAFSDPTHKHFFTARSMDNFIAANAQYGYTQKTYTMVGFWYGWPHSKNRVTRVCKRFMRNHSYIYDTYLSLFAPVKIVVWELEKRS